MEPPLDPPVMSDGEYVQYLEAEVERLQAIVDKLPKCWRLNDAGELVQDVPVVPGVTLWYHTPAGIVPTPELLDWDEVAACVVDDLFRFCSTREAAEAAGKEE